MEINRVAVIGLGTMGAGIAQVLLEGGVEVVGRDVEDAFLERARGKIEAGLAKRVEKGRMTAEAAYSARSKLTTTTRVEDCADVDVVVEAIVEELDAKAELIKTLDDACPDADLATTTSSLGIGDISGKAGVPRLYGLHVFNPVPVMELVEVILPDACEDGLHDRALEWCHGIGKTAVVVPDTAAICPSAAEPRPPVPVPPVPAPPAVDPVAAPPCEYDEPEDDELQAARAARAATAKMPVITR